MLYKTRSQSKLFFIVLFLLLISECTFVVMANSTSDDDTSSGTVNDDEDSNDNSSDKDASDDPPEKQNDPSKPSSPSNSYPDNPLPSKSSVTSAMKYATAVSLAETKPVPPPEISSSRFENTLQVAIESSDSAPTRQVSVLGQTYDDDADVVNVQLPSLAQSLTYVLVIVYQQGELYARYVPIPELSSSLARDGEQDGFGVFSYLAGS